MSVEVPHRNEQFVAYPENRPCERVFITVRRVARDGSWADIAAQTWAVGWTKRQKLPLPHCEARDWDQSDLDEQQTDHFAKLASAR